MHDRKGGEGGHAGRRGGMPARVDRGRELDVAGPRAGAVGATVGVLAARGRADRAGSWREARDDQRALVGGSGGDPRHDQLVRRVGDRHVRAEGARNLPLQGDEEGEETGGTDGARRTGGHVPIGGEGRRAEGRASGGETGVDQVRAEGNDDVGGRLADRRGQCPPRVDRAGEEGLRRGARESFGVLDRVEVRVAGEGERARRAVGRDVVEPGEHRREDAGVGDADAAHEGRERLRELIDARELGDEGERSRH